MTGTKIASLLGVLCVFVGAFWLAVLAMEGDEVTAVQRADRVVATPRNVVGPSVALRPRVLSTSDLGTGSAEFSAVALNETDALLLIVDDAGFVFEFALDPQGVPIEPPRRTLALRTGGGDPEGITWLGGSFYAIASEDDGSIIVVDLLEVTDEITDKQVARTFETGIRESDGSGIEGVAPGEVFSRFLVAVRERPPTLYLLGEMGEVDPVDLGGFGLSDASDVWVDPGSGVISVVSDESQRITDFSLTSELTLEPVESMTLVFDDGRFAQAEGVVRSADGSRLYVVGEDPGSGRFSFGYFTTADE